MCEYVSVYEDDADQSCVLSQAEVKCELSVSKLCVDEDCGMVKSFTVDSISSLLQ